MNTDLNLLFTVLALQSGLITDDQFVEVCTLWTTRKGIAMSDLLLERGWIVAGDVSHIHYLLDRRLEKSGGDARQSIASIDASLKRQLASIHDAELQQSLGYVHDSPGSINTAITLGASPDEEERYSRIRVHATGGGGRIWLAHDRQLDRDVALKELRLEVTDDGALWARFQREARITGQLEHPGIVPVYEYVRRAEHQPFYTMRFVKGRTLAEAAREYHLERAAGRVDPIRFVSLLNAFTTVCNTIAYAHSRGVIHRDLKGQNIVLGDFGEVVVLDWGLAKLLNEPDLDDHSPASRLYAAHLNLTIQGQAIGTPGYMAPEQAAGRPELVDRRTDIYGLGAILYEILAGHPPFTGSDTKEVMRRVREEEPLPPSSVNPLAPEALEQICLKAIRKTPSNRYESAADLAKEVQLWQDLERRKVEQQFERFFNLTFELLCFGGFDGYFKRVNPAFERALGYSNAEMMAHPWLYFIHPDDLEATVAMGNKLASGSVLTSFTGFRNRYRCKDGSYKWLSWTALAVVDEQLIYGAARDITEVKRSIDELTESELRYRSVVAALDEGVVVLDADGTIRACNASAERILGLSADEIVGRTAADPRWITVYEDGSPFPHDAYPVNVTLRTGERCPNVVMGVRKPDGSLNWISTNSQPLVRADGKTMYGVLGTFADITALKRTEELLRQKTRELEEARLRRGAKS